MTAATAAVIPIIVRMVLLLAVLCLLLLLLLRLLLLPVLCLLLALILVLVLVICHFVLRFSAHGKNRKKYCFVCGEKQYRNSGFLSLEFHRSCYKSRNAFS